MDQKELKAKYMDIITNEVWKGSKSMIDYANKKVSYIVELENGDITDIDKPSIETSFCFGYGYCGVSTEEDYQGARKMADHAAKSEEYFLTKNLKGINETIAAYEDALSGSYHKPYKRSKYCSQSADSKLKGISFFDSWCDVIPDGCIELSKKEIKALITGYEEVKKKFEKRLHTYLKRYGLSKVRTWSFLVD